MNIYTIFIINLISINLSTKYKNLIYKKTYFYFIYKI